MEVARARADPGAAGRGAAGDALHGVRQPRGGGCRDGPWGELLPAVTVPVNARNRVQWVLGEQLLLPRLAARAGVDLVHSLASTAPLWGRFRRVVTSTI